MEGYYVSHVKLSLTRIPIRIFMSMVFVGMIPTNKSDAKSDVLFVFRYLWAQGWCLYVAFDISGILCSPPSGMKQSERAGRPKVSAF